MNKRIEIKKWLIDQGLTQAQIARELGVSRAFVSLVVKGERRSEKVLTELRRYGCPDEFLQERAAS